MEKSARVVAVHLDSRHRFSKHTVEQIQLLEGLGVEGDAHAGSTVQHVFQKRAHATPPNLRQVHLMHQELFASLAADGFSVQPGELGENITTLGIDLLGLPRGTLLHLGDTACVEVTGLRNPCVQIEKFQAGLLKKLRGKDEAGHVIRRAGIMGVVRQGGVVRSGDSITAVLPSKPYKKLTPV